MSHTIAKEIKKPTMYSQGSNSSTQRMKRKGKTAPRNPKLVYSCIAEDKQCPSAFMAEMMLTTDERLKQTEEMRLPQIIELLDMSETTHQKVSTLDVDQPLFQPFPSEIIYQNYEPFDVITIPLQLRNNDKVARLIKVLQPDSPYFCVSSEVEAGHKVAPGMEVIYYIQFKPNEKKDYHGEIICVTEREKFIIPIQAIGARALLDFPDQVVFDNNPVKYKATKTLLVRNVGTKEALFTITTEGPFSISPETCTIDIGVCMQIDVSFEAAKTGSYSSNAVIGFDTGENVYVTLHGEAIDVNVRMDKNNIKLENTFVTSATHRTVSIVNRSDVLVHYAWKLLATSEEEEFQKERFYRQLSIKENNEKDAFLHDCLSDPTIKDKLSLISRSFLTMQEAAEGDPMLYDHETILIEPVEGDIWPNSQADIQIVFKPSEAKMHERTVYCDVTGRETRLPLKIKGEGLGPVVEFSFDVLDIENVFYNSEHCYEVVLVNKGDIDAIYSYERSDSEIGEQFTFIPARGVIASGECTAIQILFKSPHLGEFSEVFQWSVGGSPHTFTFCIRGNVVGPTYHFDTTHLSFGNLSYGFTYSKVFKLSNTSDIPMTFDLDVPSDGKGETARMISQAFLEPNESGPVYSQAPKEFELQPCKGVLEPHSMIEIEVCFTPLHATTYDTSLLINVEGSHHGRSLPLSARCVIPSINVIAPMLDYGRCCLRYPYEKQIILINGSEHPAKYYLLPQIVTDTTTVHFYSPHPKGIIPPDSSIGIPLIISTRQLEDSIEHVLIVIDGNNSHPLKLAVTCFGEGPVIYVDHLAVDFGTIPVLKDAKKKICLSNQSLIPAKFFCQMSRSNSAFNVSPKEGIIPSQQIAEVFITANLDDTLRFSDKLQIATCDGPMQTIDLSAQGSGTSIVSEPPLCPSVKFGPLFSCRTSQKSFKLTNKGKRLQQIFWTTEGFPQFKAKKRTEMNTQDMKYQNIPPPPPTPEPVFKLVPDKLMLAPHQSQEVILHASCDRIGAIKETMICHSIVGNNTGKEKILKVEVSAEFIQPLMKFSTRNLNFCVTKYPSSVLVKESQDLTITNVSLLPLSMKLQLKEPFSLMIPTTDTNQENLETIEMDLTLNVDESAVFIVQFDPSYHGDSISYSVNDHLLIYYKDHPTHDVVQLKAEVFFPNLTFETDTIDFKSILNDTEVVRTINMINCSPIPVDYQWNFIHRGITFEHHEQDEGLGLDLSDGDEIVNGVQSPHSSVLVANGEQHTNPRLRPGTSPAVSHTYLNALRPRTAPEILQVTGNRPLLPWTLENAQRTLDLAEVFDILPLFGSLQPGENQQIQITFYGHEGINAMATAVCSVLGGPDYNIELKGQASTMSYSIDRKSIDFGQQVYDQQVTLEIAVYNTGKVAFDFECIQTAESIISALPGFLEISPDKGYVEANSSTSIQLCCKAGLPDTYSRSFEIRVSHFEPEQMIISGEGIYPTIAIDLPRASESDVYQLLADEAIMNLKNNPVIGTDAENPMEFWSETELNCEIERLQVKSFVVEEYKKFEESAMTLQSKSSKKIKRRPQLLDYVLDFGHVIYGKTRSHTCQITNPGSIPVSLVAQRGSLNGTGFSIDLSRVKELPGLPSTESVDFTVTFDPKAASLPLEPIQCNLPIKILNGPLVSIVMKAVVTAPDLKLLNDAIDFGSVICGQCKVVTVQLHNQTAVRCDWTSEQPQDKKKKSTRNVPMHLRKHTLIEKPKPKIFEILPPFGSLNPGERLNVQVKFMPFEEVQYNEKLILRIIQSADNRSLLCKGNGTEPRLDFDKSILQFEPVLPYTSGDEIEVIVTNPTSSALEFYSVEFDKQYLHEEEVLRTMPGYDENGMILIPPRQPGDQLPDDLLKAHAAICQKIKREDTAEAAEGRDSNQTLIQSEKSVNASRESINNELTPSVMKTTDQTKEDINRSMLSLAACSQSTTIVQKSTKGVGELEVTPVAAAIAKYLGIDLSAEGKAARNRRGIAIIVHGAPLSGKTATAVDLANRYKAIVLSIDQIVEDAIQDGRTSASLRARDMCRKSHSQMNAIVGPSSTDVANTLTGVSQSVLPQTSHSTKDGRKTSTLHTGKNQGNRSQHPPQHTPPPSSPPPSLFGLKKIEILGSPDDTEFYTCVLPEDLIVEIIAERLQMPDCHTGVVFDGLESLFTASLLCSGNVILKAVNNRKHIYCAVLKLERETLLAIEEEEKRKEAEHAQEVAEKERIYLEELSEDEYEAMTEEERNEIDRKKLSIKKKKIRKKRELELLLEKERDEREMIEEKRLEEENKRLSKRRVTVSQGGHKKGHDKDLAAKERKHEKSFDRLGTLKEANAKPSHQFTDGLLGAKTVSSIASTSESESTDDHDSKRKVSTVKGRHGRVLSALHPPESAQSGVIEAGTKVAEIDEHEKELIARFTAYRNTERDVIAFFEHWDRATGTVIPCDPSEKSEADLEQNVASSNKRTTAHSKKVDKERLKEISENSTTLTNGLGSTEEIDLSSVTSIENEKMSRDLFGLPLINVSVVTPKISQIVFIDNANILPSDEQVWDGLGCGSSGPPIPPPATFSIVVYPEKRTLPHTTDIANHFVFVTSSPDDPNGPKDEQTKLFDVESEKPIEKEHTKRRKEKDELRDSSQASKKQQRQSSGGGGRRTKQTSSALPSPPSSPLLGDDSVHDAVIGPALALVNHRWSIQPHSTTAIKIRFNSTVLGQFDQTLHFEIVGTRRRYQIFCRGICMFPGISREPRIVFPHRKKYRKPEEIVLKKFILSNETLEFGPLLAGKNRDRYKEGKYPENMEKLCIKNLSLLEAELKFCFQNDTNAATFLLFPPKMKLKPGESHTLSVWAYPKTPGFFEDTLVICIKENPEPTLFKLSCHGVRPELELDKRVIQFERVLLHRKETRTVYLRNSTLLPIAWKLTGLDNLGDDFSVLQDHGVIEPKTEFALQMHFRAVKTSTVKKIVRLEVSDADNVLGLAHAENIQVHAEAYDVALDMSFPKGADGGLDFGNLRVFDETKQACSLKNRGKYEIAYNFVFESHDHTPSSLGELFTVIPAKGSLIPSDRPTQVQVIFRSKSEVEFKDLPILKCQIIEPNLGDGEMIACIPVKISARSVYSRYAIYPVNDLNFGAVLVNTKKTKTFTIENKGEFEFKYSIVKLVQAMVNLKQKSMLAASKRSRSREGSVSGRSQALATQIFGKPRRTDSIRGQDFVSGSGSNTVRLQIGAFTVFPATGVVSPGSSTQIAVDMISENPGYFQEEVAIDISERPPTDHPTGISYHLMGESSVPSLALIGPKTIGDIFEEHRIVSSLNLFISHCKELASGAGVYGEDQNKFLFCNVVVGQKVSAKFKLSNPNKIPCDVVLAMKSTSNKPSQRSHDVYDVEPQRAVIPSYGSIYASVTFLPPSMQSYSALFEASVDGIPPNWPKSKSISFEVCGDGNLPRLCVIEPTLLSKQNTPMLVFSCLLVGRKQRQHIVVKNEGVLPCRVTMSLTDPTCSYEISKVLDDEDFLLKSQDGRPVTKLLNVGIDETCSFGVLFCPVSVCSAASAEICLSVIDNPFEDISIQLIGESFQDDVTLDNIHGQSVRQLSKAEKQKGTPNVPIDNHVMFNDCSIGIDKQMTLTITNHTADETIRFAWTPPPQLKLSPCCGHLLPSCAKDITATYSSLEPFVMDCVNVPCKISKIVRKEETKREMADWDDRMRVVKWLDSSDSAVETTDNKRHNSISTSTPDPMAVTTGCTQILRLDVSTKQKVIEAEIEPTHSVLPGTSRDLDLFVSARTDYAAYKCNIETIEFKDTMMFQTRMFSFDMVNAGKVQFEFAWNISQLRSLHPPALSGYAFSSLQRPATTSSIYTIPAAKQARRNTDVASRIESRRGTYQTTSRMTEMSLQSTTRSSERPATSLTFDSTTNIFNDNGSTLNASEMPFHIAPDQGIIAPGESMKFIVRFEPFDVHTFRASLSADILNLPSDLLPPKISLQGKSLMPWCHFELEASDYIETRRNPELKGPSGQPAGSKLDPNTKVLEFQSCGIKTKSIRKFFLLNPTESAYTCTWSVEDKDDVNERQYAFVCKEPQFVIEPGKKHEAVFEFDAGTSLSLVETFWIFKILEHNTSVPFLMVGKASEPFISLDQSHVCFQDLLIGYSGQRIVNIINDEDISFSFEIDSLSCHSAGHIATVEIEPMTATIPPKTKIPLIIKFKPTCEEEVCFNVKCVVRKKKTALMLNIKAGGFQVNATVSCENSSGQNITLSPTGINAIQFGNVEINDKVLRYIHVENNGRFNIEYSFELKKGKKMKDDFISATPESGTILPNQKKRCQLSFCPPSMMTMKDCFVTIKILHGPTYKLCLLGNGVKPSVDFSWTKHDFGPCFLHCPGLPVQEKSLTITNAGEKEVCLECIPIQCPHLQVDGFSGLVSPLKSIEINVRFFPRSKEKYENKIKIQINGISTQEIEIRGEGAELKIEVSNPVDRRINLGASRIGQTLQRVIPIANKGMSKVTFKLDLTPSLPILTQSGVIDLSPTTNITLEPKQKFDASVKFSPKTRIPSFSEEVMVEHSGIFLPLFVLTGSCHGVDIVLDSQSIPFGSVTHGSSSRRTLVMINRGDIGASFCWNVDKFKPDFTINPIKGYISPGMEVAFNIVFNPTAVSQDVRYDNLRCAIEGGKSLKLVLTGTCVSQVPIKEVLHFVTHVRTRETKNISLQNKTNDCWIIKPVFDGEFWSGADSITLEPQQYKNYDITYRPLTMTVENKRHAGSVFFAFPDGSGMLQSLSGTAEAPKPTANTQRDVPCKTHYTEVLQVSNWLRKSQRFKVNIEILRPEKTDLSTTLTGLDYIDVQSMSKKEYKLNFFAHKEGVVSSKITFKNEQSGEYQFYYTTFKASPAGILNSFDLTTPVRQSTSHVITVYNPMLTPVNIQTSCNASDVNLPPQFTIPAQSNGSLTFEYLPLKTGSQISRLTLQSSELGQYLYDLHLSASAASKERPTHFVATLGSNQTQSCKFINYVKSKTEYQCKTDCVDFISDKTITAASASSGGSEVSVDVMYEPCGRNNSTGQLTVTSNNGGEYVFPLIGRCQPSKPNGPYLIKATASTAIPFKNVFIQTTAFTFHTDVPCFTVKSGENIRAKKLHNIMVGFDGNMGDSKTVRTGKLIVSCRGDGEQPIIWTFYLKGITLS